MIRHATAVWNGSGKEGNGKFSTESGALEQVPYSYKTRFTEEKGSNPEELIAAAHAGCFAMKLSFILGEGGFTPDKLEARCEITFENGTIMKSHITVTGSVPGMDQQKWDEAVKRAEKECPISKMLASPVEVSSEGKLG